MKDLLSAIWNIFRHAGRILSILRNSVFNILFLLLVIFVITGLFKSGAPDIQDHSILKLTLSGNMVEEQRTASSFGSSIEGYLGLEAKPRAMLLQDVLDIISSAADDPAIEAILLELKHLGAIGLDQMQTVGEALVQFKATGKKIIAAEDYYTQNQYYLASHADTIILNPMGVVELHGFGQYRLYFKEAVEKLQVNYHVFRVGTYKSAIEPLTRNSMSAEARAQNGQWLGALWQSFTDDITGHRSLPPGAITDYIENIQENLAAHNGDTAQLALTSGLVDNLFTRRQLHTFLRNLTNNSMADPNVVSSIDYLSTLDRSYTSKGGNGGNIGIIVAEGNILGGKQPAGIIGSDTLVRKLEDSRKNRSIKAVVLRVNSGGGSAFASELIRQEILELKKSGKPLIVSMGTVAASGGYWIAADADQIWASPTTLTGSIGIFGAIPTFERSLSELGIYSDGVGTTSLSAGLNLAQPLTPAIKNTIQLAVNNGYERFLKIVENGRHIERDKLASLAEGRVFSGERARDLGLVDHLGSLSDAVKGAAGLAGLDNYSPVYIHRKGSIKEQFMQHLLTTSSRLIGNGPSPPSSLQKMYRILRRELIDFVMLEDPHGIYAHAMLQLPF